MHCKRVCVWRVNYDVPFSKYMPKFLMGKCVRHEFLISMADTETNSMTDKRSNTNKWQVVIKYLPRILLSEEKFISCV